jgi:hypothetical protein
MPPSVDSSNRKEEKYSLPVVFAVDTSPFSGHSQNDDNARTHGTAGFGRF